MTMTLRGRAEEIRWHEFHRWLSPFGRWRGSFVTRLTPEEIGARLYARMLSVPQPETTGHAFVKSARSVLRLAAGRDGQEGHAEERESTVPWTASLTENDPIHVTLAPDGFSLDRYRFDTVRFRGRFHETETGGTRIDATFGWHWSWRWILETILTLQVIVLVALGLLVGWDQDFSDPSGVITLLLSAGVVLFAIVAPVWEYVGSSWLRRNDYREYCKLIADLLGTNEDDRVR